MTLKYRITFSDGRQATILDPAEKSLPEIQASILGRFGEQRVAEIERQPPANEPMTEPPPLGGFFMPGE